MNTPIKIESPSNKVYKKFLDLTTSSGLRDHGLLLLSGDKLVREYLKDPALQNRFKLSSEIIPEKGNKLSATPSCYVFSRELFNNLDVIGTHSNILVLETSALEKVERLCNHPDFTKPGIKLICPLGDPGNLGAVLRSAQAFGVSQVFLTQEACHPFLPKTIKASAGSSLHVPLVRCGSVGEVFQELQAYPGFFILESGGTPLPEISWSTNTILLVGEEGPGFSGLSTNLPTSKKVSIPTAGVESLNAVVATSLALYDYREKQGIKIS